MVYYFFICTYKVTVSSYKKTNPIGWLPKPLATDRVNMDDTDYAFLNRFSFQFKWLS